MKLRRIWAVARKEFTHVIRDPRSLGMAIAIPMLLLVLFGYALTLDVDNVPMVVWDRSETPTSRSLISRFGGSRYFSVRRYVRTYAEVERAIDRREALVALVLPVDFQDDVQAGRSAAVQIIVDGSDSNTATIAIGYAEAVGSAFSEQVSLEQIERVVGPHVVRPLDFRPRVWFNPDLQSGNYIIPGLIAIIMMVIAALLTSLTVAREWENGTMEQLISTPVKGPELVLGKLLPYFAIGMFDVLLAVVTGLAVFHVPLRGSAALVFVMAGVFLAGTLSLGMIISIVTKSQLLASQMAMVLTFLPSFLLSGFAFAIANMPQPLRIVTYLIPARYFVSLLKGIYLKGVGLKVLGGEAALLAVFACVVLIVANARLRKKLD